VLAPIVGRDKPCPYEITPHFLIGIMSITHIIQAGEWVQTFVLEFDRADFKKDVKTHSAVIRQIEVMGEATKRISDSFKANHPEIAWRKVAGMRDILIHGYDRVNLDEVWNVTQTSLPHLLEQLKLLVSADPHWKQD